MAGGDLGGLFFSLGVKDNASRELDKLMTKFINMDASVNKTADSIKKLSDNIKLSAGKDSVDAKQYQNLSKDIESSLGRIVRLRSEIRKTSDAINNIKAIPNFMKDSNLMSSLNKLQGYLRTLGSIDGNKILDGNRVSAIFSNGSRIFSEANVIDGLAKSTTSFWKRSALGSLNTCFKSTLLFIAIILSC